MLEKLRLTRVNVECKFCRVGSASIGVFQSSSVYIFVSTLLVAKALLGVHWLLVLVPEKSAPFHQALTHFDSSHLSLLVTVDATRLKLSWSRSLDHYRISFVFISTLFPAWKFIWFFSRHSCFSELGRFALYDCLDSRRTVLIVSILHFGRAALLRHLSHLTG